jgi:outer membrane lipoprotein-sorting protein
MPDLMPAARRLPSQSVPGLLLAGLLALSSAGRAADAPPPNPDAPGLEPSVRLALLLERSKLEQAKVTTLQAAFTQRKESALLAAADETHGRFLYAAGPVDQPEDARVRWEYGGAKPMTVVIADRTMTTWYQDLGRAERVKIGRYADQVMKYLGSGGSLESLYQYFTVAVRFPSTAGVPYQLDLAPRYSRIKKKLAGMTIWVDRARFLPTRFRYLEADGDTTEYEFRDLEVNAQLPTDAFALTLPAGVVVKEVSLDKSGG